MTYTNVNEAEFENARSILLRIIIHTCNNDYSLEPNNHVLHTDSRVNRLRTVMSFGSPGLGAGSGGGAGGGNLDPEVQRFIEVEGQKARFQANVHQFTDLCWDKCIDKVPTTMDSRTQRCFTSCVDRFMDVTNVVMNKLTNLKSH